MVFGKDSYDWLDDFKIYGNGNTASFNPTGSAYYFYLKRRGSDIKDVKDVFAEKIFDAPKQIETTTPFQTPVFSTPVFEREKPIEEIVSPVSFSNIGDAFDDSPF
jgi:hypothetical protein